MVSITLSTYSNLQKKYKALQDKYDLLEESEELLRLALEEAEQRLTDGVSIEIGDKFHIFIKESLSQTPVKK